MGHLGIAKQVTKQSEFRKLAANITGLDRDVKLIVASYLVFDFGTLRSTFSLYQLSIQLSAPNLLGSWRILCLGLAKQRRFNSSRRILNHESGNQENLDHELLGLVAHAACTRICL